MFVYCYCLNNIIHTSGRGYLEYFYVGESRGTSLGNIGLKSVQVFDI